MQCKPEGNERPKALNMALVLAAALGVALLFSAPQAALAQRGGQSGDFNKWDKGWQGQDGHRQPQARPGQDGHRQPQAKPDRPGQRPPQAKPDRPGQRPPQAKPDRPGQRPPQAKPDRPGQRPPQAKPSRPSHRPPQAKPGRPGHGGGDFKRFNPGIDRNRAHDLARGHKMTGYRPLPDSVRRSMHIGRPLPPRAYPRPVPDYMRRRLPHHPGYEWRITGRDLVLVAVGSLIIYEIFDNVFY